MPIIRSESSSECTVDSLPSSSISLQNLSPSSPIGIFQIVLIAAVAVFILVAAVALVRVLVLPSTSDEPKQATATPATDTDISHKHAQSLTSENEKGLVNDISLAGTLEAEVKETQTRVLEEPASQRSQPNAEKEDVSSILSVRAGAISVWRRNQRMRTASQSSTATATTHSSTTTTTLTSDSLCSTSVPRTSVTSMISALYTSGSETDIELDGAEEEAVVYEVKRAQTQSMEVKRGILISWRASNASLQRGLALPTVIISESEDPVDPSSDLKLNKFVQNGFLHPQLPSTQSLTCSESSTSTVSVDLDEFPLPPKFLTSPSPSMCSTLLMVPDGAQAAEIMDENERSTVDRVIMLYA